MGLFSKEECCFCGKKVGMLSRSKIKSGEFICYDCLKRGNPFVKMTSMTKDELSAFFNECEMSEAYFKKTQGFFRRTMCTVIYKTWIIYDNFQTGEFVLETPETDGYPHYVFKMDQVFPAASSNQILNDIDSIVADVSAGGGTNVDVAKKKYYNMISLKASKNDEGKVLSWVMRIPYNNALMEIETKFPGSVEEKQVRRLQATLQALIGSYNTDKRLTPTQLQEIQNAGVSLGNEGATSAADAVANAVSGALTGLFK